MASSARPASAGGAHEAARPASAGGAHEAARPGFPRWGALAWRGRMHTDGGPRHDLPGQQGRLMWPRRQGAAGRGQHAMTGAVPSGGPAATVPGGPP
jgi:hypothetical protein